MDEAALSTYSGTIAFPSRPALSGVFHGQGVSEYKTGTTSCDFIGVFGEAEAGMNLSLVGWLVVFDGPFGTVFFSGSTATGCISADGAFTITETDALSAGLGALRDSKGSVTFTGVGFTLGSTAAPGAYGFLRWSRAKGTISAVLPTPTPPTPSPGPFCGKLRQECKTPLWNHCCPGLICVPASTRAFCENP